MKMKGNVMEELAREESSLRSDIDQVHNLSALCCTFDKLPINPILRGEIHFLLEKIGGK